MDHPQVWVSWLNIYNYFKRDLHPACSRDSCDSSATGRLRGAKGEAPPCQALGPVWQLSKAHRLVLPPQQPRVVGAGVGGAGVDGSGFGLVNSMIPLGDKPESTKTGTKKRKTMESESAKRNRSWNRSESIGKTNRRPKKPLELSSRSTQVVVGIDAIWTWV